MYTIKFLFTESSVHTGNICYNIQGAPWTSEPGSAEGARDETNAENHCEGDWKSV